MTKRWCFTLQEAVYAKFRPEPLHFDAGSMEYLVAQEEKAPSTGQIHIQGYVHFKARVGLKKAKMLLGYDGGHFEIARATEDEAGDYCKKDETRNYTDKEKKEWYHVEFGKRMKAGERVDLTAVKDKIAAGAKFIDLTEDPDDIKVCARYGRFVEKLIAIHKEKRGKTDLKQIYEDIVLRPWQAELLENIDEEVDSRAVYWVVDTVGNSGKSWLCGYLRAQFDACILSPGKFADMAYLYAKHDFNDEHPHIVCFDCSRTTAKDPDGKFDPLSGVYSIIECMKNGCVQSTKYEPCLVSGAVHVLAFSNFCPDLSKLSMDRWHIFELKEGVLSAMPLPGSGAAVEELNPQMSGSLVYHP